ncbi:MAG: YggU family protein [Rhodocyclaceae bacterium]|nr:YggU family protein [Rhodocyclaceae bacterium]MBX3668806.1 YggU family protein [Rhodocyclaceae bacterium]
MPAWITPVPGGALLALHIQPGAKTTQLAGTHGDALKIRLAAPPLDGRANAALIAFLAQILGLPRRDVELVSGSSARAKRVRVAVAPERALALLAATGPV